MASILCATSLDVRRERLIELMERRGLGAVLLRRPENFAWYTGGGNSRVDYTEAEGVADVLVTRTGEYVLASTIEAPRMRTEEVPGMEVVEYPWHEGPDAVLRELVGAGEIGADSAVPGTTDVRDELSTLRRVLDRASITRLHSIGAELVAALDEAASELSPGMSEHDADPDTERRQAACDRILDRMRDEATRPGRTLADAFADCRRFYAEAGFPDEWRLHHQGGITGYASREVIATPHTDVELVVGQAFAWNPSITGAKAEETFVLTRTGAQVVPSAHPRV